MNDKITANRNKLVEMTREKLEKENVRVFGLGYTAENRIIDNNHDIIIGGTGKGKTSGYVRPNLMYTKDSCVVVDSKRTLSKEFTPYLKSKGFSVYTLDFANPKDSITYNPLDCVERFEDDRYSEIDLSNLAQILLKEQISDDRFWVSAASEVVESVMAYVIEKLPPEDQHMGNVVRFYQEMKREINMCIAQRKEVKVNFFETLAEENPESHAVSLYRDFIGVSASDKTWACIQQFASNALRIFMYGDSRKMLCGRSTLDLGTLGREKTVLFVNVSDTCCSLFPIVSLFYSNLFTALFAEADNTPERRLRVPVRIMMDDFGSNIYIPDFAQYVAVLRSRNISISIIIQDLNQFEIKYPHNEASTIINNCGHMLFLGTEDSETRDYIAVRANKLPSTISNLPDDKAWYFASGQKPVLIKKVPLFALDIEKGDC